MDFGFDWDVWTVRMVCECGGDERIHCLSLAVSLFVFAGGSLAIRL